MNIQKSTWSSRFCRPVLLLLIPRLLSSFQPHCGSSLLSTPLPDVCHHELCSFYCLASHPCSFRPPYHIAPPPPPLNYALCDGASHDWMTRLWQGLDKQWVPSKQRQTSISSLHYLLEFKSHLISFYCVWARLGTETTLFKPSTLASRTALHKSDYMFFLFYDSEWGMENCSRLCI